MSNATIVSSLACNAMGNLKKNVNVYFYCNENYYNSIKWSFYYNDPADNIAIACYRSMQGKVALANQIHSNRIGTNNGDWEFILTLNKISESHCSKHFFL